MISFFRTCNEEINCSNCATCADTVQKIFPVLPVMQQSLTLKLCATAQEQGSSFFCDTVFNDEKDIQKLMDQAAFGKVKHVVVWWTVEISATTYESLSCHFKNATLVFDSKIHDLAALRKRANLATCTKGGSWVGSCDGEKIKRLTLARVALAWPLVVVPKLCYNGIPAHVVVNLVQFPGLVDSKKAESCFSSTTMSFALINAMEDNADRLTGQTTGFSTQSAQIEAYLGWVQETTDVNASSCCCQSARRRLVDPFVTGAAVILREYCSFDEIADQPEGVTYIGTGCQNYTIQSTHRVIVDLAKDMPGDETCNYLYEVKGELAFAAIMQLVAQMLDRLSAQWAAGAATEVRGVLATGQKTMFFALRAGATIDIEPQLLYFGTWALKILPNFEGRTVQAHEVRALLLAYVAFCSCSLLDHAERPAPPVMTDSLKGP